MTNVEYSFHGSGDDEEDDPSLGGQVKKLWNNRKKRLEHDDAITAWALCVMPEVRQDVADRMTGEHNDAMARVVRRLHNHPNPNPNSEVQGWSPERIVETFSLSSKWFAGNWDTMLMSQDGAVVGLIQVSPIFGTSSIPCYTPRFWDLWPAG